MRERENDWEMRTIVSEREREGARGRERQKVKEREIKTRWKWERERERERERMKCVRQNKELDLVETLSRKDSIQFCRHNFAQCFAVVDVHDVRVVDHAVSYVGCDFKFWSQRCSRSSRRRSCAGAWPTLVKRRSWRSRSFCAWVYSLFYFFNSNYRPCWSLLWGLQ